MTDGQKKLISEWTVALAVLVAGIAFQRWITNHWAVIWLPASIASYIAYASTVGSGKGVVAYGHARIREVHEKYPILKTWVALYGFCVSMGVVYIFFDNSHLLEGMGVGGMLALIAPLLLPSILTIEKEKFQALSRPDKGDSPFNGQSSDLPRR